ncbi:MAG TPA: HipA domain-containing protein [Bacteroidales bacterium]|mgnify:FL=1|nr:HipA domain-containing protein [Bacteroidales bacterium]HOF76303.1 HipA domain-containing protein [Bacteroidales bacterium]HOQ96513.1 HipA domain-containing protein [Bacteroidales bacterium]HPL84563.1 HipA domain-containing protein [Bacteroidales bacterium]HPU83668.1 HipA domain-containing protein [Bacteroidales bacterium]
MHKLLVYADFEWFDKIKLLGTLNYERLREKDSFGFEYNNEWLRNHASIQISADVNNYPGPQFSLPGKDIFGCFSDVMPDRWGRFLLNKLEQILALEEKRPLRKLASFDYLAGVDDFSRMGGFRFKENEDRDYLNSDSFLQIPPLTDLRELIRLSQKIEKSDYENKLPDKKWIMQLIRPGASLGGARPKASVVDENQKLCIAKFPSLKDTYDVGLWEQLCNILAKKSGIRSTESKAVYVGDKYHTFVARRFDRTEAQKRIHFASAMTLLGFKDGDNATTGKGYLDIVDFIVRGCTDVRSNLEELFRRVAFNIGVGNSDDHFRNHGFLLTPKGWTLSPAYDMNPTLDETQSLLLTQTTNEANPQLLLDACSEYMLDRKTASGIMAEVGYALSDWEKTARILNIPGQEIEMFRWRFEKMLTLFK